MDELYREYLAYLRVERGSSPLTVSAYAADLKDYAQFLEKRGVESLDDVDREVIVAYESDLFGRGYAASTVDRHVSVLKGFHRFLVREGYARRNPADTYPASPRRPTVFPTCFRWRRWTPCCRARWTKALWPFATGPSSRSCTVAGCA